jgi:cysteine-rich repeat protein
MLRRRPLAFFIVALAVVLAMAPAAGAGNLLAPVSGVRSLPRGVARGRAMALGRKALADLRTRTTAVVPGFPLGSDATVDLEVRRFEPFAPGARVEAVTDGGVRQVKLPDHVYFTGTVRGEPDSRVLLIAAPNHVRGFVAARGTIYPFGPDRLGRHRSYALRDVDPTIYPPPGDFCANDLHREKVEAPAAAELARTAVALATPPIARTSSGVVGADAAIDTDHELWAKFGSDAGTLDYLASLAAAVSAIDERDVGVRLRFSYIRLWPTAADPWSATATDQQLDEVQSYWNNPSNGMDMLAGSHDLVHFISGKAVQGGIAYIGTVCNPGYAFGVSQVYGSFDLSNPSQIWDVLVVTHEIGHNLGTPHTHCYGPPVDECYNQEPSCYAGPIVCSRGTIMSYCHLNCGGLPDIDLVFGDVVSAEIRSSIAGASCLTPVGNCGNGTLDAGEQCDDGNTAAGDGCGPTCQFEVCGNHLLDPGETCDDGNTVSGDGCSATCQREPRCGDGAVDPGEQCDDGNTVSGDGCSARCRSEACHILRSGQTLWLRSLLSAQRGASGRDRLALKAGFAISSAFATLDPPATGMSVEVENGAGDVKLDLEIPPGAHWTGRHGRWLYRDPAGRIGGLRKLEILDDSRGGVPGVNVSLIGRNGSYSLGFADVPLAVTVMLGDTSAGAAGSCGRRSFGAGSCDSTRGGTRLVCH